MTAGVPAPAGWTSSPYLHGIGTVAEWVRDGDRGVTQARLRIVGPITSGKRGQERTTPARIELRTGIASLPPDFGPDEARRFGWALLRAMYRAADLIEGTATGPARRRTGDVEPDDGHLTIFDFEELARG